MRRLAIVAVLLVGACGGRGEITSAPPGSAPGDLESIIVASYRKPVEGRIDFGKERAASLSFAQFAVSVPPNREPGTISYPGNTPNADKDFLIWSAKRLTGEAAFVQAINDNATVRQTGKRDANVFIHGFNTNFAEGMYLQAQMQHDLGRKGANVNFSWPSAASAIAYVADRESALYSRDALARTLDLMAMARVDDINVFAHSMGTFLLMDTLRTMALSGHDTFFAKHPSIILISPDIDIDVFKKEAAPVLARGVKIYVLVSRDDKALNLSAKLRGATARVGSIRSSAELAGINVIVIDLSNLEGGGANHNKVAASPAMIAFVNKLRANGKELFAQGGQTGLLQGNVAVVQNGSGIILTPQ